MCGRFYIDDDTAREIERTVRKVDEQLKMQRMTGDIYPTQPAGVIQTAHKWGPHEQSVLPAVPGELIMTAKKWGFPGMDGGRVIINARAETALERRMFRDSVLRRRIVVPASGYYEWNQSREKVTFTAGNPAKGHRPCATSVLYMAGFYNRFGDEDRFVILTTAANDSVRDVHDRMPLILEADEVARWLQEDGQVEAFLHKKPKDLQRSQEFEQQILKF